MSVTDRVRELVEPLLAEEGLEVFDIECSPGRVAILVDRPSGLDLDAITVATQRTPFSNGAPRPAQTASKRHQHHERQLHVHGSPPADRP
jgi:hypothetical protein